MCQKGYCQCHEAGLRCDPKICSCINCHNYEGAPEIPKDKLLDKSAKQERKKKQNSDMLD